MEWTGKETAMNKQEDIREKIKIIAGSIAAAFLLAFVLYMAFLSRSIAGKNESQGTLRTLQENSTYELTVLGKQSGIIWIREICCRGKRMVCQLGHSVVMMCQPGKQAVVPLGR